ncbi:hypothetical protein ABMA27_016120 [Loxostege sticticalis]|uniref:Mos1 transposase HTH domain-containing protein n=1 Tax=Loxostege sticticalis TaxID=481309 RepID=A0ABR3I5L8_LOXSC
MMKFEHRAVIKFLSKEGNTPTQIRERMLKVFGDSSPSEFVIKFWSKQFKHGRESLEDDPRSGRPISAVTADNVEKVKNLILADRRIKQWEIARDVGISKERVHEIIHEHLGMSKYSCRSAVADFVPAHKGSNIGVSRTVTIHKRRTLTAPLTAPPAVFAA